MIGTEPGEFTPALVYPLVELVEHGQARGQGPAQGSGSSKPARSWRPDVPNRSVTGTVCPKVIRVAWMRHFKRAPVVDQMESEAGPLALRAERVDRAARSRARGPGGQARPERERRSCRSWRPGVPDPWLSPASAMATSQPLLAQGVVDEAGARHRLDGRADLLAVAQDAIGEGAQGVCVG